MIEDLKQIRSAYMTLIRCAQKQGFNDNYETEMWDANHTLTILDSIIAGQDATPTPTLSPENTEIRETKDIVSKCERQDAKPERVDLATIKLQASICILPDEDSLSVRDRAVCFATINHLAATGRLKV